MQKTWLITGANRGFGLEIARAARAVGDHVLATSRSGPLVLDVTDPASITRALADVPRVDVLVNNAGYGQIGMFEEISPERIRAQLETNVLGAMNVTRAVLPLMRKQRNGRILNIASTSGIIGFDGASIYVASKFALVGWSESLSLELARFGIHVTAIFPGMFRTDFLDDSSAKFGDQSIADYHEVSTQRRAWLADANHNQPGDPKKLAAAIVQIANTENPPTLLPLGNDAIEAFESKRDALQTTLSAWRTLASEMNH